jgi:hypothetical protein
MAWALVIVAFGGTRMSNLMKLVGEKVATVERKYVRWWPPAASGLEVAMAMAVRSGSSHC